MNINLNINVQYKYRNIICTKNSYDTDNSSSEDFQWSGLMFVSSSYTFTTGGSQITMKGDASEKIPFTKRYFETFSLKILFWKTGHENKGNTIVFHKFLGTGLCALGN